MHHRFLHGHVLQHDHRLGRLLFRGVVHVRTAVDVVRPPVEYQQLRARRAGRQRDCRR